MGGTLATVIDMDFLDVFHIGELDNPDDLELEDKQGMAVSFPAQNRTKYYHHEHSLNSTIINI